jgi:hypothetical protein
MKLWLLVISSCCILVGCTSPKAGSSPSSDTAPNTSDTAQVAGKYVGNWTNVNGVTGTVRISLKKPNNSPWQGKVSFTYEGDEATTIIKSVKVNGTQIAMACDYEIQGTEGAVEMTGKLAGNTLQGNYSITKGDGSPGTWRATRVP